MSAEAKPKAKGPTPPLEIKRFAGRVQRGAFSCGEREIDQWLLDGHRHHSNLKSRIMAAHLKGNATLAGFYSMSIQLESDEDIEGHGGVFRTQHKFFPAVRVGYLAVQRSLQACGIGSLLMTHAVREFGNIASSTGICALTLTAISEERADWYEREWKFRRYGKPCNRPKMFFPAQAAIDLIEQNAVP